MSYTADPYDVFFSYHWRDHAAVEAVAQALHQQGLHVFLDRWYLVPGCSWPQALEEALTSCRAVAVFVGSQGLGPWQQREKFLALSRQVRQPEFPVIPVLLPGADPALGFLSQNTWVDLRQRLDDPLSLAILQAGVRGERPGSDLTQRVQATLATVCPYRGLRPFREEDAPFFFGRKVFIDRLMQAVSRQALVALVGASGCGKSSVARAGLIPHLRRPDEGGPVWEAVTFRPGDRPLHALAAALLPLLEPEMTEVDRLAEVNKLADYLREGRLYLRDVVVRVLAKQPGTDRLLLVADQWEELYTLTREEQQRCRFMDEVLEAIQAAPLSVVLTLRGDFFGQALSYRPLADRLQGAVVNLGPMTREEMAQAVERPAKEVRLTFEPRLVERLLDDVGQEPGNLPLLEFALSGLWEHRQGGQLLHQVYDEMGRVQGAVAQQAEELYQKLVPLEQQAATRVFLELVQTGEGTADTRRRAGLQEIGEEARDLVKKLADARLVVTGRDEATGRETVEVAHEALIRHWNRLRGWLNADREFLLWRQRLRHDLSDWERTGHDQDTLLRGTSLSEAQRWLTVRGEHLSLPEKEFIQAGIFQQEQERQAEEERRQWELEQLQALAEAERQRAEEQIRAKRRLRRLSIGLAVTAFLAIVAGLYALAKTSEARQLARVALSRQLAAQALDLLDHQFDRALLLSVQAYRAYRTREAENALLTAVQREPRIRTVLHGHTRVQGLAFSPDGVSLSSANFDGTFTLWDLKTRSPSRQASKMMDNMAWAVAFGPNGQTLASSDGGTIVLWDAMTQRILAQMPNKDWDGKRLLFRGPDIILSLAFSPDGHILASGREDGKIILWDVKTCEPLGPPLMGHGDLVISLAFSPDGRTLASGSRDASIILWDLKSQKPLAPPLIGHYDGVASLAFSPSGNIMASGSSDNTIIFWDVKTRGPLDQPLTGHTDTVTSLAFSPDGQTLASGSSDATIFLFDTKTRQLLDSPLAGHRHEFHSTVTSLVFSPDGETLASGSDDATIILWDTRVRKPSMSSQWGHRDDISSVVFSPDGRILASASDDRTVILWDAHTQLPLGPPLEGHRDGVQSLAFSPDGSILASAGGSDDPNIILWNSRSRKRLGSPLQGHQDCVHSVAFSPDGRTLASGSRDRTTRLWNVASQKPLGEPLKGYEGNVFSVAFSPDGRTLASGGYDGWNGNIIIWDLKTLQPLGPPLKTEDFRVFSVAFSPDGHSLASGGDGGTVILWDPKTLQPLGRFQKEGTSAHSIAFSPDGALLASGGSKISNVDAATITIWNLNTQQPLGPPLAMPGRCVQSVAFSPDGKTLAAGSDGIGETSGAIMCWDVQTRKFMGPPLTSQPRDVSREISHRKNEEIYPSEVVKSIERACKIANRSLTRAEWRQYLGDEEPYRPTCPELPVPED